VERFSERIYASVLYRLRGEFVLAQSKAEEAAEADFLRAIEIAQAQKAKSLELQAAMSLYKLHLKQDRGKKSQAALAKLYNWFTEGFGTADLQEAKALLSTQPGLSGKRRLHN
jgi:adenylate cyclase